MNLDLYTRDLWTESLLHSTFDSTCIELLLIGTRKSGISAGRVGEPCSAFPKLVSQLDPSL